MALEINEIILPPDLDTSKIYSLIIDYNLISMPQDGFSFDKGLHQVDTIHTSLPTARLEVEFNEMNLNQLQNITGFQLIIKSINSNKELCQLNIPLNPSPSSAAGSENFVSRAIIDSNKLILKNIALEESMLFSPGQYYKIFIAYKVENEIGYFGSPITCLASIAPLVNIKQQGQTVIGSICTLSEKLVSSYYVLKDTNNNIIYQGEEMLYNYRTENYIKEYNKITQANSEETIIGNYYKINFGQHLETYTQIFTLEYDLEFLTRYQLEWHYKLSTGYEGYITWDIVNNQTLCPDFIPFAINAELDRDNGLINLYLNNNENKDFGLSDQIIQFYRSRSKDNYQVWEKIGDIKIENYSNNFINNQLLVLKDFNIDFGESYQYAYDIKSLNTDAVLFGGIYKIKSNFVTAWFDDVFLFDNDKQLRIAFNPKVTNFKSNIKESKIETIGGQFPYFYRNKSVNYKEFSLSGLLSYKQDPDQLFMYLDDLDNSTNLSDNNFLLENKYKNEVYDWLNNGKFKKLKTSAEGNYTVRLMNVNMTPQETLGRMLHTFNCTAIETEEDEKILGIRYCFNFNQDQYNFATTGYFNTEPNVNCYFSENGKQKFNVNELIISNVEFDEEDDLEGVGKAYWVYEDENLNNKNSFNYSIAGMHQVDLALTSVIGIKLNTKADIWFKGQNEGKVDKSNILKLQTYTFNDIPSIYQANNQIKEADLKIIFPPTGYYKSITFVADSELPVSIKYKDLVNKIQTIYINKQLTLENIYMNFDLDDVKTQGLQNISEVSGIYHYCIIEREE